MGHFVKILAEYVAYIAEGLAAFIIVFGVLRATWIYLRYALIPKSGTRQSCACRIQLGHSLSLALEFLVGADILKTAIAPTWSEIGQLASIIAIRTAVNVLLMWELEKTEKEVGI